MNSKGYGSCHAETNPQPRNSRSTAEKFVVLDLSDSVCNEVMARACGHDHLQQFGYSDLSTWKESMARLSGIAFCGIDKP